MSTKTTFRVYLSSTLNDLQEERKVVREALEGRCTVIQSYGASEKDLIATCRDDVTSCAVYVGILGLRYGYRPPGDNPDGKSITELELEAARQKGLDLLLFVKTRGFDLEANIDSPESDDGKRIRALRQKLGSGAEIVPFQFESLRALEREVVARITDYASRHQPNPLLDNKKPHPALLRYDLGLVFVPGTDDAARKELTPAVIEPRFHAIEVSPKDGAYLATLEDQARPCRSLCWVLTPASLGRFQETPQLLPIATARLGQRYGGRAALLLDGLSAAQLPVGLFEDAVEPAAGEKIGDALERCWQNARARAVRPMGEPTIPLPCVVVALTTDEAAALIDDSEKTLSLFGEDEKGARAAQLERLKKAVRSQWPAWPQGFYGNNRDDWRPFGPAPQKSLGELLESVLARLNDVDKRSGRDRVLLGAQLARIVIRPYSFDEWLDDRFGSRSMMEGLRDRGCLVLVDEIALLHPTLRQHGDRFLSGERTAVISANPCDPAHQALERLIGNQSLLHVGGLPQRYRDQQDPRCELAINNVHRFERWLRMVLPELIAALGQTEPGSELRNRMADALSA